MVATLAESLQDAIKTDTIHVTKIVTKVGTLLQSDHHKAMQMISSIMSKGKELASSLTKIEGSASQVLILPILLGVIVFLLLVNTSVTCCARNTLINRYDNTVRAMGKESSNSTRASQRQSQQQANSKV